METTTLTKLKNSLSSIIDKVKKGESILILEHGRPVAQLTRIPQSEEAVEGFIAALEREGLVSRPESEPPSVTELRQRVGKKPLKFDAVQAIIDERRNGR